MKLNFNLEPADYYTQRNNRIRPNAACMPTARVMYYRGNKISYTNPTELADDDYLMQQLNTDEAVKFASKKYKWAFSPYSSSKPKYPVNELHGMYNSYLDALVVGHRTSDFLTDLKLDGYIDAIKAGYVIMTSGKFRGLSGHAFCVIGYDEQDNVYLADPWGDWRTGYKDVSGYGIKMTRAEFVAHVKPPGNTAKWAHLPYDAIEILKR